MEMIDRSISDKRAERKKLIPYFVRIALVVLIDGFTFWFGYRQALLGNYNTVIIFSFVAVLLTFILLYDKAYPYRWMAPGLALLVLFSLYPNILTIYIGFTNYGTGHLLTKEQTISQLEKKRYLPEGGKAYDWTAYKSESDEYALWLQNAEGDNFLAFVGEEITQPEPGTIGIGELDTKGIPKEIEGYKRLNAILAATDPNLETIQFGSPDKPIMIRSPQEAAELEQQYVYDPLTEELINQETGMVYRSVDGIFTSNTGDELKGGYQSFIGIRNFIEFFTSPALRGPLLIIMMWNFLYPTLAVLTQFGLGLFIAIMFNDPDFPGKKLIRSFLLLPFTIPSLITILIWRGMLNTEFGVINRITDTLFGISPDWFADPWLAKGAIVLVALWLGFPYFMLISSGALQSIPKEVYQAARVDGASGWQSFRHITLPLLLVAIGPLLLASYIMNFNNFNLMFLLGGPPIANSPTPANHTDILISYVYRLAFEGGRGQRFGLASAITLIIFVIVFMLTLIQFRYTKMWEEVSENV